MNKIERMNVPVHKELNAFGRRMFTKATVTEEPIENSVNKALAIRRVTYGQTPLEHSPGEVQLGEYPET